MDANNQTKSGRVVTIYTDGGCDPNPGVGGWGAILIYGAHVRELSGGAANSTNNRMEMTAAIEALRALKRPCEVHLHTDSQYLMKGITSWIHKWKCNNWQRGNKVLQNADLWKILDGLTKQHAIQWHWVRGHQGDPNNERCDQLATEAIRAQHQNTART